MTIAGGPVQIAHWIPKKHVTAVVASRPKTASNWLFQELRAAIIRGDYRAGEPIRQDAVADAYSVSRMPVREAMRLLEAEGLVEQVPHRGAVVADLDADDARELFEVRAALEVLGIRRSFPMLNDAHIKNIENAYRALTKAKRGEVIDRHREFHLTLYSAAGARLRKLIAEQLDAAQRYHLRFGRNDMVVSKEDDEGHQALVKAAREGDVKTATRVIRSNMIDSGKSISRSIARRQQLSEPQ